MASSSFPQVLVGAVSERDVDLLLIEEFASSPEFVRGFLAASTAGRTKTWKSSVVAVPSPTPPTSLTPRCTSASVETS